MITLDTLESIWNEMDAWSDQEIEQAIEQMGEEQPFLMVYFMEIGDGQLDEDEQELLYWLGQYLWVVFKREKRLLSAVAPEELEQTESSHGPLFELADPRTEEAYQELVQLILQDHQEEELVKLLIEVIEEQPESFGPREETKGFLLIYLLIVVDTMIRMSSST